MQRFRVRPARNGQHSLHVPPKIGEHLTHATRDRKAPRFADAVMRIAEAFPKAGTIRLVMDNLSTHCEKPLGRALAELAGRRSSRTRSWNFSANTSLRRINGQATTADARRVFGYEQTAMHGSRHWGSRGDTPWAA